MRDPGSARHPRSRCTSRSSIAFLIQVPATIAISAWQRVPPPYAALSVDAGRGIRSRSSRRSALARTHGRRRRAALTPADLFVPPDAGPPFIALAFAIIGAVVRGARLWALISVGAAWLDGGRRQRGARRELASVPRSP